MNAWVNLFKEFAQTFGMKDIDMNELYGALYNKALEGYKDCGGLLAYNYFSGEHITGFEEGRPLFVRKPDSNFNLANFMRVHLYTALGALKTGLDILMKEEDVKVDKMLGHGGLFKTEGVGQKIMAAAVNAPVSVMKTAGEGGAWGMAILAAYMLDKAEDETLDTYLSDKVFAGEEGTTIAPDEKDVEGFDEFIKQYQKGLASEELQGEDRAKYGAEIIKKLAKELSAEYGKGYTKSNLYSFYSFYKTYPEIFRTSSGKSVGLLSWSHYATLLQVKDKATRDWYEKEAAEQTWSVRTLQRNISSQYYYHISLPKLRDEEQTVE